MLRRQKPGEHHNYPEHRSVARRLLWRLGFDPLTVYERLAQVRHERDDYARMMDEAQQQVERLADFIMAEVPGEPSQSQGAVDTAIRLLREQFTAKAGR